MIKAFKTIFPNKYDQMKTVQEKPIELKKCM